MSLTFPEKKDEILESNLFAKFFGLALSKLYMNFFVVFYPNCLRPPEAQPHLFPPVCPVCPVAKRQRAIYSNSFLKKVLNYL